MRSATTNSGHIEKGPTLYNMLLPSRLGINSKIRGTPSASAQIINTAMIKATTPAKVLFTKIIGSDLGLKISEKPADRRGTLSRIVLCTWCCRRIAVVSAKLNWPFLTWT
jgi:hypothetical protein